MTLSVLYGRSSHQWLPVVPAVLAASLRLTGGAWPIDDAYISFRYARNLATGLGFVYNAGQPVLGTSTPLYTLLLAAASRWTPIDIPHLAVILSAVADGVGVFLLYRLARRLGLSTALCMLCALTWAFYPLSIKYAVGGMETSLVSLLILAAYAAWLSGSDASAMTLVAAAVLVRPDSIAVAFTLLVGIVLVRRSLPWRPAAVFVALLTPWLIFATVRFGSPLPQSVQAKSHGIYIVAPWESALQVGYHLGGLILGSPVGLSAKGLAVYVPEGQGRLLIGVALTLFVIWAVGAVRAMRFDRRWVALFAFPVVFALTYAVIGLQGRLIAEWYLVPLTPFWLLGLFAAFAPLSFRGEPRWRVGPAVAFGAVIAAAQVAGLNWGRTPGRPATLPLAVWTEREAQYRQAADFLRTRLRVGDVVAASEIGTIGYYCECRILDPVGLVSPEAVRYYPLPRRQHVINYAVPPKLIRDRRPDYLISLDVFIKASLGNDDWFRLNYRVIRESDSSVFGSQKLLVFAREL